MRQQFYIIYVIGIHSAQIANLSTCYPKRRWCSGFSALNENEHLYKMSDQNKRSLDERLDALTMNLEMLTRNMHDARERMDRLDRRERQARKALLSGIIAYMTALEENNGQDAPEEH